MRILTVGDVVSSQGCEHLRRVLPSLKKEYRADAVIVNGENSAVGNGILPESADYIFTSGADVITLGNHALRRREIYNYLDEKQYIIRPSNLHPHAPGKGSVVIDKGAFCIGVVNIMGNIYLDCYENAFDAADREIENLKKIGINNIIIDFHAEATSEKKALGFYVDSRVSAVFGTHTHVQTSDNQILPGGTGYITDIGMTGPYYSVIGVRPDISIEMLRTKLPVKFSNEDGPCTAEGCFFEIDNLTGKTVKTERFRK